MRRVALAAQGLTQAQPFGTGIAGARAALGHLGYIQIDSISVVERAPHHVLRSRVPNFVPAMTNKMLLDNDIFEYWAHAAAFLPMADFRFSLPYKHALKAGQTHWYKNRDKKLMRRLLDRIRVDGPLQSRDLESPGPKRGGWWDWKPSKQALEQLYMQGDLMVSDREGFQKTYDLTERVLPPGVDTRMPDLNELAAHLLDQQLRCHGLVAPKGVTYLRRNAGLRHAVKALVEQRLAMGTLESLRVNGGEVFVLEAGLLDRRLPRVTPRVLILSPFDNSVIQRERLRTLFQFDYQIECYVPAAKRKYGYFCLPLLFGDRFIGRMDCKAHRKDRHLEIKFLHLQGEGLNQAGFPAAFASALHQFREFQRCDTVSLNRVHPRVMRDRLESAVGQQ